MAISKIKSAGITADFDNTLTAADIAANAIGISELDNTATGITSDYHKVPTFANDTARDAAIGSPAVGMIIYNTASEALQQYNGTWAAITPAPSISSVSGFLNDDTDSTLTIFGGNFSSVSVVKMFTATAGGSQIGSNATTTFNSSSKLTAIFGAGSIGASGSTAYIEVDNAGLAYRFATAITVNADPTVTHTGATGTGANTTNHLGTYAGAASAGGPSDSNTKLLLNFDRGGGTDIEDSSNTDGNGHKVAATNAVIKASTFGDGKTAMWFDGANSGDFFAGTGHADFAATGDFTIDCWLKRNSNTTPTAEESFLANASASTGFFLYFQTDNRLYFGHRVSSSEKYLGIKPGKNANGSVDNGWHHFALTRQGDAGEYGFRFFWDGVPQTLDYTNFDNRSTAALGAGAGGDIRIGCHTSNTTTSWDGYIDEVRIVKNEAIFTKAFTPSQYRYGHASATHEAATASNVCLLVHSNLSSTSTTLTNSAANSSPITLTATSDAKHSTLYNGTESTVFLPALTFPASGKSHGSTGAYFDGATDYITINSSPVLGTGNFTIDFWINVSATQNAGETTYYIWEGRTDSNTDNTLAITMNASDQLQVYNCRSDKDTAVIAYHADTAVTAGTWTHVALVRSATSVLKLYIGGVATANTTSSIDQGDLDNDGTSLLGIQWQVSAYEFTGYIDVFRISNTARWAANFTPDTVLYGEPAPATIPTITFTGAATQLAGDEDIEFTAVENSGKPDNARSLIDTDIGLTLTNLTGADKNKATLTGGIATASTTYTNMPLKLQVRKTLSENSYNNSTTVTFTGSTVTTGLAPGMLVSGTGIPADATISTVDSATQITLSAATTGGAQTDEDLIFLDLTRVSHQYNGSDTINNADAMYTIATGASTGGAPVLFNARRYMGSAAHHSITGFGFKPDMVWTKSRASGNHNLYDSLRGATTRLFPHDVGAQVTTASTLTSFDFDGFSLGTQDNVNTNNAAYSSWGWKAGGAPFGKLAAANQSAFGAGSDYNGLTIGAGSVDNSATGASNAGPIKSSVNQTSGFSITEFNGGNSGCVIPHHLGGTPEFVIVKGLTSNTTWTVWHKNLSGTTNKYLLLNENAAEADSGGTYWPTAPSSTVVTCGSSDMNGGSGNAFAMYAWKAVSGVSHFGSYSGSAGAKTITGVGFSPRFIIIKGLAAGIGWVLADIFSGFGGSGNNVEVLFAENSGAEHNSAYGITPNSDGWSMNTSNSHINASGTYIFAAFA